MQNQWSKPRRRLRAGLTQLLFALAGLVGGWAISHVNVRPEAPTARVFDVLMAVGFAVLSIAAVIFSLLFLVVQWAASNLTPRLNLFRDDPIVWRTFAYIVGVFVFCITAALSIGRKETVSAIIPFTTILLALGAIALIRRLQIKAFASIQLAPMLAAVTAEGAKTLASVPQTSAPASQPPLGPVAATITWPGPGNVLQQLHTDQLAAAAQAAGVVIVMRQQIGNALLPGAPLADIHGPAPIAAGAVLTAVVTGLERTFGQDPLLAFRLLADIGLRALSAAINDPATAVQAIDRLHEMLLKVIEQPQPSGYLTDETGTLRVVLALPSFDDYLRTGLDDVIAARGTSPLVTRRLRELLDDLNARANQNQRPLIEARIAMLNDADQRASWRGMTTSRITS